MKKKLISFILAFSLLIPLLSPINILAKDESASSTPSNSADEALDTSIPLIVAILCMENILL